jgi:predicted nucleotidyltransferase
MSTQINTNGPGQTLFGKTRRLLLSLLFGRSDEAFYLTQLIRMTHSGPGAVQRELALLSKCGLISRRVQGRQVYFQANKFSPVFHELRSMMLKTAGLADILTEALSEISKDIRIAFIYGSVAKGRENADSDIDIMIIGSVTFAKVASALFEAQNRLGREINPSVFSVREFAKKNRAGDHFVSAVLKGEKVFVVGDGHELARLVE